MPYPPGAFNDTLGRIVSQKLQEAWGVSVVVENRAGGGTLIGTEAVGQGAGRRLHAARRRVSVRRQSEHLHKLPYDTVKDFPPVIFAGRTPNLLVVGRTCRCRTSRN